MNRRRQPFQGCALPPELPGHVWACRLTADAAMHQTREVKRNCPSKRAVKMLEADETDAIITMQLITMQRDSLNGSDSRPSVISCLISCRPVSAAEFGLQDRRVAGEFYFPAERTGRTARFMPSSARTRPPLQFRPAQQTRSGWLQTSRESPDSLRSRTRPGRHPSPARLFPCAPADAGRSHH